MLVSPGLLAYQACIFVEFDFNRFFWATKGEKSYLHGIALPEFFIFREYSVFIYKKALSPTFVYSFLALELSREFPDVTLEQNSVDTFWS